MNLINKNKINVFFGGDISYKSIVANFLETDILINEVNAIKDAQLIYWVYGSGPKLTLKTLPFWLKSKQKIIIHWIGTDVLSRVTKSKSKKIKTAIFFRIWNKLIEFKVKKKYMLNLCCAPWLCDELKQININSKYIPLTTIPGEKRNFKEKKREYDFMTYLPHSRWDFYNGDIILRIAKELKSRKFLLCIPDINNESHLQKDFRLPNITVISKIPHEQMTEYYRKSKCFLRFTNHDGLSLSVIEALMNKLHVFWTYHFPYVQFINITDSESLKDRLNDFTENWEPNSYGQEYAYNNLNIRSIKNMFSKLFRQFYDYNS